MPDSTGNPLTDAGMVTFICAYLGIEQESIVKGISAAELMAIISLSSMDIAESSGKITKSTNQMHQDVNKGKAPKSVERVDKGNTAMKGEQDHVHFKDGNALNRNGTWKEGAGRTLTRSEQQWLQLGGFTLPE